MEALLDDKVGGRIDVRDVVAPLSHRRRELGGRVHVRDVVMSPRRRLERGQCPARQ